MIYSSSIYDNDKLFVHNIAATRNKLLVSEMRINLLKLKILKVFMTEVLDKDQFLGFGLPEVRLYAVSIWDRTTVVRHGFLCSAVS